MVELLAVIAIIGLMMAVTVAALRGGGESARMRGAVDTISALAIQARQQAVNDGAPVALVVLGPDADVSTPEVRLRSAAVFQFKPALNEYGTPILTNGIPQHEWVQISRWRTLPEGIVLWPGATEPSGVSFFNASPQQDFGLRGAVRWQGRNPQDIAYQIFLPGGRLHGSGSDSATTLRLIPGSLEAGGVVPRGPTTASSNGMPSNSYDILLLPHSGRVKIEPLAKNP